MYSVASALAKADSPEAVASAVLNEGVAALGAMAGGVLLATDAEQLSLPGAVGYDEDVLARLRAESRNAELPAAVALRTGEPVWLESRAERDRRFPDLVGLEAYTASLCAVPLEALGRRLGALRFSFREPRLFDEDERSFVVALAAQTAQALYRTQLQAARTDVSRRLQRSLLPPALPEIEGLDVAAIYRPFGDGVEVGGDFYDVWPIAPGRWALAIGDAAGTGPEAAALTAVARHTLRALTISDTDPIRTMGNLNKALCNATSEDDDRFITALFGVITIDEAVQVTLSGGGHPPVFVRRADGTIETVNVGGSLLGVLDPPEVGVAVVHMRPGDTAVLVTDGVLEARREGRQFDAEGVEGVLATATTSALSTVTALEAAVRQHTGGVLTDDVAAIVLHRPVSTADPATRRTTDR
jgi:serine phosphatase RsbU (regulator of sigma subunit)